MYILVIGLTVGILAVLMIKYSIKFIIWSIIEAKKNVINYQILELARAEKKDIKYMHEKSRRMHKRKYQEKVRQIEREVVRELGSKNIIGLLLSGYFTFMFADSISLKNQFQSVTGLVSFSEALLEENKMTALYDCISPDILVGQGLSSSEATDNFHLLDEHETFNSSDYISQEGFNNLNKTIKETKLKKEWLPQNNKERYDWKRHNKQY